MELYAVIMAGGVGSRFWPKSRERMPKQLLKIFGKNTMIQDTVKRISKLVKKENIFIITNKIQKEEVLNQLENIPDENVIAEPFGKNTAACIGLASLLIRNKNKDAVTVVLPADHLIQDEEAFLEILERASEFAYTKNALMTIGIEPTRPETGYGYIQREEQEEAKNIYKVKTFAEKPLYNTAVRFLESGDFLWNSGMFIWKVDQILKELAEFLPDTAEGLSKIEKAINSNKFDEILEIEYGLMRSISIDYGVMEKSRNVYVIKSTFSWSDVGSWEEVYLLSSKDKNENHLEGNCYIEDVSNSFITTDKKFVSVVGVKDLIIINTDDALLVCNRNNSQDVKKIVDYLKKNDLTELL